MTSIKATHEHETLAGGEHACMLLADQLEEMFSRAGPRLLRRARTQGIAQDVAEDLVQETLLEAWRSLEHLRDETRFTAWLDGIYRNVRLRHRRKQGIMLAREAHIATEDDESEAFFEQLADPHSFDPNEELARQDMAVLLDRTLGYLAPAHRILVERHYLAEVPQRELAAQLGLTLSALEARLHRARNEMLRVLSNELHTEALSFGLALDPSDAAAWRETRLRCVFCGQGILQGVFEPMENGRINLRLRCPVCKTFEINSLGLVELQNARSFLPATKKMLHVAGNYYFTAIAAGGLNRCWICGQPDHLHIVRDDILGPPIGMQSWIVSQCGCPSMRSLAVLAFGALPEVRAFMFGSDRIVIRPEVEVRYDGRQAIRCCLLNLTSGRRLHIYAEAETLAPLAVIEE